MTEHVRALLGELAIECEDAGSGTWVVRVPSAKRGQVAVQLIAGERTLTLRAFFMRGPDRDHVAVYRRLLRKNLGAAHWRFALDDAGDVFLVAQTPLPGLDAGFLDRLLGVVSGLVDETYEGVLRTGFDVPPGVEVIPPPGPPG